jgi:hypothetical protein
LMVSFQKILIRMSNGRMCKLGLKMQKSTP